MTEPVNWQLDRDQAEAAAAREAARQARELPVVNWQLDRDQAEAAAARGAEAERREHAVAAGNWQYQRDQAESAAARKAGAARRVRSQREDYLRTRGLTAGEIAAVLDSDRAELVPAGGGWELSRADLGLEGDGGQLDDLDRGGAADASGSGAAGVDRGHAGEVGAADDGRAGRGDRTD